MGFGRHVGGGDDVLISYGSRERVREYVRASGGEMGGGVYGFSITTCFSGQRIFGPVIKIAGCGDM